MNSSALLQPGTAASFSFDSFHPPCIDLAELCEHGVYGGVGRGIEGRQFSDCLEGGEALQPPQFHEHPVADQTVLANQAAQPRQLAPVAAIERRYRGKFGQLHGHSGQGCRGGAARQYVSARMIPHAVR